MHVEGHVKIAFIRVRPGSLGGYRNQPADRLARAEGAISIRYRNGIDVPVVAVAVCSQATALGWT